MSYINNPEELSSLIPCLPDAETAKIAVVRPTSNFQIVTPDNPDMIRTLKQQSDFVEQKLARETALSSNNKAELVKQFEREFQSNLSKKAYAEQMLLKKALKQHGIAIAELLEDKGKLEGNSKSAASEASWDYYTDQVFATDTGQYFDDNGQLAFIPSQFKNQQRKGEERLAIRQASNLNAVIKPLISDDGKPLTFEGGDIRQMPGKKLFFIGQGHRSDAETSRKIAEISGYTVVPIALLQAQFYHLDCCFLPLPNSAAVIYEGEFVLNDNGEKVLDEHGWPKLQAGTETMTPESRALIRAVYSPEKLVLIGKEEALAFATNAAILHSLRDGRFKMFVNGHREAMKGSEKQGIAEHIISYSQEQIKQLEKATGGSMDVVEVPYKTMHGSGGSIRCSIQELACTQASMRPDLLEKNYFSHQSDAIDRTLGNYHHRPSKAFGFFPPREPLSRQDSDEIIRKMGPAQ